jgi:DNA polymerase III subunit beta
MKFSISREQLIHGLQAVQNIVGSRTTLPILSNVLLRADVGRLELTALPVKRLFGIVRELVAPEVEIEVDEKHAAILRSGSSYYKINGLAAEEFPPLPQFTEKKRISLPQEKLKSMLRRTSFAISSDETRYVLNGIFISLKEHKMTMVATDGRRLALVDEETEVAPESYGEFIIPTKAINELSRLLQHQGDVDLRFTENQVAFTLRDEVGVGILIISKLVEGSYPNYRQVIPTEVKERISLAREELLHALRRAEIMTSEKSNSVKLSFTRNNLAITANTPEVGEARESIAINYKGADVSIAFNPGYFMDPLKALDNDEVFLELIDELSPGVLKINGPFLYVIMPMRMT